MKRIDKRELDQMRPVRIERNYIKHPEGSVLISVGDTKVICNASVENGQPRFMKEQNIRKRGWVTAEYSMLPRSTSERMRREVTSGRIGGRTQEIQRLIGRSLRAITDLDALGERTIWIDCDVIQADGGTRTAAITGAFIALWDACKFLIDRRRIKDLPIIDIIAATSVGILDNRPMLDLCYVEDSNAEVDMNIIMTGKGKIVEVQGTAEKEPFTKTELNEILELGESGIRDLIRLQKKLVIEDLNEVNSCD